MNVTVGTDVVVLPLGVTREFACTSPPGTGYAIAWGVNGTSGTGPQLQDYIALGEVHSENGGIQRNLTFTADARANNTHILCAITNIYNREYYTIPVDMNSTLQGKVGSELIN